MQQRMETHQTEPRLPSYQITELTHLTIKRITKFFTLAIITNERPNCETNWPIKIGRAIPYEVIWPTLGTPLSDATEEKNWRKMLHRGIFTRNRDPAKVAAGEHWCRMGCKCEESMLHLTECWWIKPYWNMVKKFIRDVLNESPDHKTVHAIVFNMSNIAQAKMMSTEACAFTRHAFDTFWRDFALVDTNGKAFIPEYTFRRTMENFHNAVLAYGQSIKQFKTQRRYTNLKKHIPEKTLEQFPTLITINPATYDFELTDALKTAYSDAHTAAKAYADAHKPQATGGSGQPIPPPPPGF